MELNSLEAIKNAVQSGLGASFLPVVSIERELAAGSIHGELKENRIVTRARMQIFFAMLILCFA